MQAPKKEAQIHMRLSPESKTRFVEAARASGMRLLPWMEKHLNAACDAAEREPVTVEKNEEEYRKTVLAAAVHALEMAQEQLSILIETYSETKDGKFSACHPHNGFCSMRRQLNDLRSGLKRARV